MNPVASPLLPQQPSRVATTTQAGFGKRKKLQLGALKNALSTVSARPGVGGRQNL